MEIITFIGLILICGYFFGLIAEKFNLPRVTAYILAGVLFSPNVFGDLFQISGWSETFSQICLGFIAYIIGGEIDFQRLKKRGSTILLSTFFESLLPVVFVFITFYFVTRFFNFPNEIALILASIASTTAPAATIAIIEQYKCKGDLTDTTLGIVILDDALGILLFILISSLFFPNGVEGGILLFFKEIVLSFGIGVILGFALSKSAKLSPSNDYLFPLLVGLVLLSVGLSQKYHFSALLTSIVLGVTANNTNVDTSERISLLLPIEHIKEFFFIIFFVFSGTHFESSYFINSIGLIFAYVFARGIGKYLGAFIGSRLGDHENKTIPPLLGLTLLPQAGVALGLIIQVVHIPAFSQIKDLLFNIVLGSTIIYEIAGPLLSRYAFLKAGEINIREI